MAKVVRSKEEEVEYFFKKQLEKYKVKFFDKTAPINEEIDRALEEAPSKQNGKGRNIPDIKVLIDNGRQRYIPVMIEVKGNRGKLIKLNRQGEVDLSKQAVSGYAVNGAVHYAQAIFLNSRYKEVIAIGLNGCSEINGGGVKYEIGAYFISESTYGTPKKIDDFPDLAFLQTKNIQGLFDRLDQLTFTEEELEKLKQNTRSSLEKSVKDIHQLLYEDTRFKGSIGTSDKLFLFSGLVMASLPIDGIADLEIDDLKGNTDVLTNDGQIILTRITSLLKSRKMPEDKQKMITGQFEPIFSNTQNYKPVNGISNIKFLYGEIREKLLPKILNRLHIDFTGIILNSLKDWMPLENDKKNDVVLTPRYVTNLMARLARTDRDSFVWDTAMGSGGFLISAMEIMIQDAKDKIKTQSEIEEKIRKIKENQLLGIEILGNVYILAVINMILTGDGSSHVIHGDSFKYKEEFPASVFLLNPPYSAEGKGLKFVQKALAKMTKGYGCVLIQENAGNGQGQPFAGNILKNNTLIASIHMADIFKGKSGVQTAIYLFQVARPHQEDDLVTFIDFSEDGYLRQNRRKSTESVNLRDVDHAKERYDEVLAIVLNKKKKTDYYNEGNGKVIKSTISLKGNDWTFAQHVKVDLSVSYQDFKDVVKEYLDWKVKGILESGELSSGKAQAPEI